LEDYKNNLKAYDFSGQAAKEVQKKFDSDQVCGVMVINFWRPIGGYTKENPLRSKPLAVCDPAFVANGDTVHTALDAKSIGGLKGKQTDQMALKYSPQQQWYYYPNMTDDEVLVFKQFEVWKDDSMDKREALPVRGVFHTAFVDPNTPEGSLHVKVLNVVYKCSLESEKRRTQQKKNGPHQHRFGLKMGQNGEC